MQLFFLDCSVPQSSSYLFVFYSQAIINDPFMTNCVILVFANKQDMVCFTLVLFHFIKLL